MDVTSSCIMVPPPRFLIGRNLAIFFIGGLARGFNSRSNFGISKTLLSLSRSTIIK